VLARREALIAQRPFHAGGFGGRLDQTGDRLAVESDDRVLKAGDVLGLDAQVEALTGNEISAVIGINLQLGGGSGSRQQREEQ